MLKRFGAIALALASASALFSPLVAWAGVFKDVDGLTTYVWVDGLTPGENYQFAVDGLDRTRSVTINACGWGQLSFRFGETPPASVKIANDADSLPGATAISTAGFATQSLVCRNGVVLDAAGNPATATAPFEDQSGRYIFPGYTANDRKVFQYVGVPNVRNKKADACGLARFLHNADRPASNMTAFTFDGQAYTLAALTQSREIRCKRYKDGSVRKLIPTALN